MLYDRGLKAYECFDIRKKNMIVIGVIVFSGGELVREVSIRKFNHNPSQEEGS